jgi:hypothetical protein
MTALWGQVAMAQGVPLELRGHAWSCARPGIGNVAVVDQQRRLPRWDLLNQARNQRQRCALGALQHAGTQAELHYILYHNPLPAGEVLKMESVLIARHCRLWKSESLGMETTCMQGVKEIAMRSAPG